MKFKMQPVQYKEIFHTKCANCCTAFHEGEDYSTRLSDINKQKLSEDISNFQAVSLIYRLTPEILKKKIKHFITLNQYSSENQNDYPFSEDDFYSDDNILALCATCGSIMTEMFNFHKMFSKHTQKCSLMSSIIGGEIDTDVTATGTANVKVEVHDSLYENEDIDPDNFMDINLSQSDKEFLCDVQIKMETCDDQAEGDVSSTKDRRRSSQRTSKMCRNTHLKDEVEQQNGIEDDCEGNFADDGENCSSPIRQSNSDDSNDAIYSEDYEPKEVTATTKKMNTVKQSNQPGNISSARTKLANVKMHRKLTGGPFSCEYCEKTFSKPSRLKYHVRGHTGERPFKCLDCPKAFMTADKLKVHNVIHSKERPFKCEFEECNSSFKRADALKSHMQVHSKPCTCNHRKMHKVTHSNELEVESCDITTNQLLREADASGDDQDSDSDVEYEPPVKSARKNNSKSLNQFSQKQKKSVTEVKLWTDTTINKVESSPVQQSNSDASNYSMYSDTDEEYEPKEKFASKNMNREKQSDKSRNISSDRTNLTKDKMLNKPTRGRLFSCDHCEKTYSKQSHLQRHIMGHTGERPFKCLECPKAFITAYKLRNHAVIHSEERPFICDFEGCDGSFKRADALKTHKQLHTGEKPFVCDICGKMFTTSNKLNCHKVAHSDEIPFVCHLCGKGFKFSHQLRKHGNCIMSDTKGDFVCDVESCRKTFKAIGELKQHSYTHSEERPFICATCGKGFKTLSYLNEHNKRIHTEIFVCDICGKNLWDKNSFTFHKKSHLEKRPCVCDICTRSFKTVKDLNKHKKRHTEDRPHACDLCDKTFKSNGNLNEHKRIHTGEKPHQCEICHQGFTKLYLFTRHKLKHSSST